MGVLGTLMVSSIVAGLAYLGTLTIVVVVSALRAGVRDDTSMDDGPALSVSRFAMPVSVIVPVSDRADGRETATTIERLLDLNYPNLEVIAVVHERPEAWWQPFKDAWQLDAREVFFRLSLATAPIRMLYRSVRDPRLLVVSKAAGSAADALNCAVNLARFRYISAVEPGIRFDRDALLRAMTPLLSDPAVVGATSHVEIRDGRFESLGSLRSLLESRVVWRDRRASLGPRDAVAVWRREAVQQSGGFSTEAADPTLEMMVRLQTTTASSVRGQVVRTAQIFGHREARAFPEHVRVTARHQLAGLQAVSALRAAGSETRPMLRNLFISEVLTPWVQVWVMLATAAAAAAGWLPWIDVALVAFLLAMGHAVISSVALLVRCAGPFAPSERTVARLLLVAPVQGLVFGVAAGFARAVGVWAFLQAARPIVVQRSPETAA